MGETAHRQRRVCKLNQVEGRRLQFYSLCHLSQIELKRLPIEEFSSDVMCGKNCRLFLRVMPKRLNPSRSQACSHIINLQQLV